MVSKFSYSEVVKNLLARDALSSRNTQYQEKENTVTPVENSSLSQHSTKPLEFKYVDTLRMSRRKKVKFSVETLV